MSEGTEEGQIMISRRETSYCINSIGDLLHQRRFEHFQDYKPLGSKQYLA